MPPKNNTNTPQSLFFWETFKEWLGNASGHWNSCVCEGCGWSALVPFLNSFFSSVFLGLPNKVANPTRGQYIAPNSPRYKNNAKSTQISIVTPTWLPESPPPQPTSNTSCSLAPIIPYPRDACLAEFQVLLQRDRMLPQLASESSNPQ